MAHRFLRVGRGEKNKDGLKNDIQLSHESISRSHLEVFIDEEGNVFITDLDTKNGTFVNGHRISGDTRLEPGDILKLGIGRPINWEKWALIDTGSMAEENENLIASNEEFNKHHFTTAADSSKKRNPKLLLIVSVITLILLSGLFLFYNSYYNKGKVIAGVNDKIVYTKTDLEGMTYDEIIELSKQKPDVFLSEEILITRDAKAISLIISENKLVGVNSINKTDSTLIVKPVIKKDSTVYVQNKNNSPLSRDDDGDGLYNGDDNCPDDYGPASNNGCPLTSPPPPPPPPPTTPTPPTPPSKQSYVVRQGSVSGTFQMQVGSSDETSVSFRNRVINNGNHNCKYPSDVEEIVELNKSKLSAYQYKYGLLPSMEWIEFKCY
jgi:hypothetical protein